MPLRHISLRGDFTVDDVQSVGSDEMICQAARVSTMGAESIDTKESAGLINFLMKNRHGSPFEHALLTFRITAPIFVWREFMRHRIGFSYNEQSGRYMTMLPIFYTPTPDRPLIQIGKAGEYKMVEGGKELFDLASEELGLTYAHCWNTYVKLCDSGVAKEVARVCLPLATYSSAYVTLNPRSMMSFLSLRTQVEDSKFPSYPQWEIAWVAEKMEMIFAEKFPLTHSAFNKNGRVAP